MQEDTENQKQIAWYVRVSKDEQEYDRQMNILENNAPEPDQLYKEKITGTNTDRSELNKLLNRLNDIDEVYCSSLSRMSRSTQDLHDLVGKFEEANTILDFVTEPIEVVPDAQNDPMQSFMMNMISAMAQFEADMIQRRTTDAIRTLQENKENYHHGRPPLGYYSMNGELAPDDNYNTVCSVLELVDNDELSKRKAAKKLDCARSTITKAITERPELYDLD